MSASSVADCGLGAHGAEASGGAPVAAGVDGYLVSDLRAGEPASSGDCGGMLEIIVDRVVRQQTDSQRVDEAEGTLECK